MSKHTRSFHLIIRGIVSRRRVFLLNPGTKDFIFPPRGQIWDASTAEEAMCDAFIFFAMAELEEYFEGVIEKSLQSYESVFKESVTKNCRASQGYFEEIQKKRKDLGKNHNANWKKISHFFEFIGMKKEVHFPLDFWDDIESIASHRGDLAHNGFNLKIIEDRRNIIEKIDKTFKRLQIFDQQFHSWIKLLTEEELRLKSLDLIFSPDYAITTGKDQV